MTSTPGPDRPTADQYVEIYRAALRAGDMKGVEAALVGLAVVDPHRAQAVMDISRLGIQAADDPMLRALLQAALSADLPEGDVTLADKVRSGGDRAVEIAAELAAGLLQIAKLAMPDTYYQSDSRCQLARSFLAGTGEGPDD